MPRTKTSAFKQYPEPEFPSEKARTAYRKAQRIIKKAWQRVQAGEDLASLGNALVSKGLTALPPEIGQLTTLKVLDLEDNQLTTLPPEIGKLTALRELSFFENRLVMLPKEIGQLTALTMLWLSENQLTTLPLEIWQLPAVTVLRLSGNQLTALPPEIGQLAALRELYLYDNRLTALPAEIGQLTALRELHLINNRLTALPPELRNLTNLRELCLHENEALGLPPEVLGGTGLDDKPTAYPRAVLDYYFTHYPIHPPTLRALSPSMKMTPVQQKAYDTARKEILDAVKRTRGKKHKTLFLCGRGLAALPPEIGQLTALTVLHLDGNQLTALPPEIGKLNALTWLVLSGNRLVGLPPEIGKLTALRVLHLDDNQLTALPPEIGKLTTLRELHLSDNQLTALPKELEALTRLRELYLHGNETLGLPPEVLGKTRRETGLNGDGAADPRAILYDYFARHPLPGFALPASDQISRRAVAEPVALPPVAVLGYDVFISAKSEDYSHARDAAAQLRGAGLRVFFSEEELPEMGNSDYFDAIDHALETARHMLVVGSTRAHLEGKWVKKEWQTFLNEKLSGRKKGNLVTLLCGPLGIGDLPLSLRQHEARRKEHLSGLLNYFRNGT